MKKIVFAFFCLMGVLLITSCSQSSKSSSEKTSSSKSILKAKTPGEIAVQDAKYLYFGKVDKFLDCVSNKDLDRSSSTYKQDREKLSGVMNDKVSMVMSMKGKITDVELDSESVDPDGTHAKIILKTQFDGKRYDNGDMSMIKENGEWMVDLAGWK